MPKFMLAKVVEARDEEAAFGDSDRTVGTSAADVDQPPVAGIQTRTVVYGKYYSTKQGIKSTVDQTFFLYSPKDIPAGQTLPVHIQIHGGGFTGGSPDEHLTPAIAQLVNNGIHYMSVGYRLVATKYYYDGDAGKELEEEFIHATENGTLTLDIGGRVLSDYAVRRGRTEFNTKCSYDAAMALENMLASADAFGIDPHRISTTGGSAGGGEINYLTWVYHALASANGVPNMQRYTPVAMVYTMAQLDYPVQNMLDQVWSLWTDDVGAETKLATILDYGDCDMVIGNPWCSQQAETPLCNHTFERISYAKYCNSEAEFNKATLGEVQQTQNWPVTTPPPPQPFRFSLT